MHAGRRGERGLLVARPGACPASSASSGGRPGTHSPRRAIAAGRGRGSRALQNGACAGAAGLPQSGQGFALAIIWLERWERRRCARASSAIQSRIAGEPGDDARRAGGDARRGPAAGCARSGGAARAPRRGGIGARAVRGATRAARRRTIWRKPKPLTAVRSNGCGQRGVDRRGDRLARAPCRRRSGNRCRSTRRYRAARSRAPTALAAATASGSSGAGAVDVEQRHRRGRRSSAARRRRKAISPVSASSSTSDQPAASSASGSCARSRRTGMPLAAIRASRSGPVAGAASVATPRGSLTRPALGDRLAHDLDPQPRALRSRRAARATSIASPPPSQRGPRRPAATRSTSRAASTVPTAQRRRSRSIARLDDRAAVDQRGARLADAGLVEPFSQARSPPASSSARVSNSGRPTTPEWLPAGSARTPRRGPGWHSRRPCPCPSPPAT